jgi:hypothetical protein
VCSSGDHFNCGGLVDISFPSYLSNTRELISSFYQCTQEELLDHSVAEVCGWDPLDKQEEAESFTIVWNTYGPAKIGMFDTRSITVSLWCQGS